MATCECEATVEPGAEGRPCHECGTACCGSCALPIEGWTFCRWCGTTQPAAA